MTLRGFDAADESAEKSAVVTMPTEQTAQIPTQSLGADALAAFVAALTPEQRTELIGLLNPT